MKISATAPPLADYIGRNRERLILGERALDDILHPLPPTLECDERSSIEGDTRQAALVRFAFLGT